MDPFTMLAIVIGGSTAVQTYTERQAGKAQQEQYELQAEQEEKAARAEELKRRRKLTRAIAAMTQSDSQSGFAQEGTFPAISLTSAKDISLSESSLSVVDKLRQSNLRRQGNIAAQEGRLNAVGSLLGGGEKLAGAYNAKE